jgi:hypothetical protein
MSGSSSAFLNGYLSDREAALVKKRDLDLSELIELCAQPASIDDRVAAVKRYSAIYPELKYFLIVAYFCKDAFSQVNELGPLDWAPSSVPKGGSVETLQSMWTQVTRMYDTFPSGPRIKRGIAHQLLPTLHADDAELIAQIIAGKYYRKELNEVVVQRAFPKETPQDPKA